MRKVDKYKNVNDESFKRVVGVKRSRYEEMVNEYKKAEEKRKENHWKLRKKNYAKIAIKKEIENEIKKIYRNTNKTP